jgi:DUF4097 and DUF4098 domain-containing protein YvlB
MPEYQTPQPISVVLELRVAEVRVAAGDRENTAVEVRPSDESKPDDVHAAEQTRVEYADGRLLVKSPRRLRELSLSSDGGSIDVQIGLPSGSELSGRAAVGNFRCTGTLGRCELRSSAGAIRLDRAAAVKLVTAGDILVERATGNAELTTATGEVRAGEIDGAAVIKNSNGDVHIGEVRGELRIKSANGDVEIERCHASLTAKTANGDIRVGTVDRGSIVASTGRGRVEVGIADGIAAWLDLHTSFGHVYSDLDASDGPEPAEERVEVRLRTGFGDITIRRRQPSASEDLIAEGGRS